MLMKIYISAYLVLLSYISIAQKLTTTNLDNFSYKIQGVNTKTKQLNNAGTAFIISYKGSDFLVSNYHVFTGKDAITQNKIDELKDTCTAIILWFRSDTGSSFKKLLFQLFDTTGTKLFSIYHGNETSLLDIAILPIYKEDYPPNIRKYIISQTDIDTTTKYSNNKPVYVVGFPLGKMGQGWKPKTIKAKSVIEKVEPPFISPNISFDNGTFPGMSGSPVYIASKSGKIALSGVNYQNPDFMKDNPSIKGAGIQIKFVIDIIEEMIRQNKSNIDFYR